MAESTITHNHQGPQGAALESLSIDAAELAASLELLSNTILLSKESPGLGNMLTLLAEQAQQISSDIERYGAGLEAAAC